MCFRVLAEGTLAMMAVSTQGWSRRTIKKI